MQVDPSSFECPTHQLDLSDLVYDELKDAGFAVAYRPSLGRRTRTRRPFEVRVTCPGTGENGSHPLMFNGTRSD